MEQLPVIELSKFKKTQSGYGCITDPFCIAFVYAKEGNFVVKGMSREVQTHIIVNFPYCFYKYTFWKNGESRGGWSAPNGFGLYVFERKIGNRIKYVVSMLTKDGFKSACFTFRNMPKKWLPIFDEAIYFDQM